MPKTNGPKEPCPPAEYDLKIDEQVNEFLKFDHQVTFFIVTAAVATLGFTLNYASDLDLNLVSSPLHIGLLVGAVLFSLASACLALRALAHALQSSRFPDVCRAASRRRDGCLSASKTGQSPIRSANAPGVDTGQPQTPCGVDRRLGEGVCPRGGGARRCRIVRRSRNRHRLQPGSRRASGERIVLSVPAAGRRFGGRGRSVGMAQFES